MIPERARVASSCTLLLVLLSVGAAISARAAAGGAQWDLVVYGSSPAGVAAATAAGDLGLRVALYEPLPMIGGMGAAGFLALHDGGMNAISGLALNFTRVDSRHGPGRLSGAAQHNIIP
jgi:NADPH-dependent 2,4-dienoyl-CoA reductase/sulfur reductase-like enzyme